MAVIAGLFDSEADATAAMDRLLREQIEDLETRVVNPVQGTGGTGPNIVIPVVPNTGGNYGQPSAAAVPSGSSRDLEWLDNADEVERAFYLEGMKEGATLALAKVDDEHVNRVRTLFSMFNARTYSKD